MEVLAMARDVAISSMAIAATTASSVFSRFIRNYLLKLACGAPTGILA
jgi:predicted membrane-bound mannosyltransferase